MPFLTTPNTNHRLHYGDTHPSGGLPSPVSQTLVFIHGLGSSQNFYYGILPFLRDHHRCVTLDTYGSGRSPYTGDPVSIESIVADVLGAMDALKIAKAVVVGHSMGGLVVTQLGAKHADRISGIVAIGPTHPSEKMVEMMTKRAETVLEAGMEPIANSTPFQATSSAATALQQAFIRELIIGQNPQGYAALCRAIAASKASDYAAINVPFLLIAGDEDKSATMEGCRHIFDRVFSKNKRMEVLANVGHWHCVEAPEEVGKAMCDFMKLVYGDISTVGILVE